VAAKPGPKVIIKKKGGGHGGHHGGAWKVAYADFVTAMMALFMVMWLVASTDAKARKEIANYFRTGILPEGDMSRQGASQVRPSIVEESGMPPTKKGPSLETQAKDLEQAIKGMAALDPRLAELAANVTVTVTPDGVMIEAIDREGGESMLYDVSSAKPKPALVEFLEKLAPILADGGRAVRVMGHTDARVYASAAGKTNWDLSYERADAARRVLAGSTHAPKIDCVAAFGDTQLKNPTNPYAAENRRLGILVMRTPDAPTEPARSPRPVDDDDTPAAAAEGTPEGAPEGDAKAPPEDDSQGNWRIGSDRANKPQ
jgi:chemotaxis protein MotB